MMSNEEDANIASELPEGVYWVFSRNQYAIHMLAFLVLGFAARHSLYVAFQRPSGTELQMRDFQILTSVPSSLEDISSISPDASHLDLAFLCIKADSAQRYLSRYFGGSRETHRQEPTNLEMAALDEFRLANSGDKEYGRLLYLKYPDSLWVKRNITQN